VTRIPIRGPLDLHCQIDGPADGAAVILANALGTDTTIWDQVIALLPAHLRVIRYDLRGHGQSDAPPAPYAMGQLVNDAAAICDHANIRDAVFVGLGVGGMVAQGLAVKRPDLIRALVLSNTAAKIGNPKFWQDRIGHVATQGLPAVSDAILRRWFGRSFYASAAMAPWRAMLESTPVAGYTGTCAAISGTDFYTPTSGLRIPTLGIAGSEDTATPPDLVRETIDLIPGSQFVLMRRTGHLPCVEAPAAFAGHLGGFLRAIGHC
jgi:3-oxoadipate enol-lactonase